MRIIFIVPAEHILGTHILYHIVFRTVLYQTYPTHPPVRPICYIQNVPSKAFFLFILNVATTADGYGRWCRAHDDECEKMATAAGRIYETFVARDAALDYVEMVSGACRDRERPSGGSGVSPPPPPAPQSKHFRFTYFRALLAGCPLAMRRDSQTMFCFASPRSALPEDGQLVDAKRNMI